MNKTLSNDFRQAKINKKDELYTQLTDIEKELKYYKEYFKNKTIFCNCDDPEDSDFWNYFSINFEFLKLKKLISTHYEREKTSYKLEISLDINKDGKINKKDTIKTKLLQNGDFRSPECIDILNQSDIVVTNPPFSLFREYIDQLYKYKKKFIIIGNINTYSYKEIFRLIKENKIWFGRSIKSGDREFRVPDNYPLTAANSRVDEFTGRKFVRVKGVRWFTNVKYDEMYPDLKLYKKYNKSEFPRYDNYNAINVEVTKDIPFDYKGVMGVPITFLDKYNPNQFEILGMCASAGYDKDIVGIPFEGKKDARPIINGEVKYARIFIKNKNL